MITNLKHIEMKTRISWRRYLLLGMFATMALTASVFGQKSAGDEYSRIAGDELTFYVEGPIYDSSRTVNYMALPSAGNVNEERHYVESRLIVPSEGVFVEEELLVESWMHVPFEVEEEIEVESWMTSAWM
jgi:hypothetical protein